MCQRFLRELPAIKSAAERIKAAAADEFGPAQGLPASVADAKVFDALTKSGENW